MVPVSGRSNISSSNPIDKHELLRECLIAGDILEHSLDGINWDRYKVYNVRQEVCTKGYRTYKIYLKKIDSSSKLFKLNDKLFEKGLIRIIKS